MKLSLPIVSFAGTAMLLSALASSGPAGAAQVHDRPASTQTVRPVKTAGIQLIYHLEAGDNLLFHLYDPGSTSRPQVEILRSPSRGVLSGTGPERIYASSDSFVGQDTFVYQTRGKNDTVMVHSVYFDVLPESALEESEDVHVSAAGLRTAKTQTLSDVTEGDEAVGGESAPERIEYEHGSSDVNATESQEHNRDEGGQDPQEPDNAEVTIDELLAQESAQDALVEAEPDPAQQNDSSQSTQQPSERVSHPGPSATPEPDPHAPIRVAPQILPDPEPLFAPPVPVPVPAQQAPVHQDETLAATGANMDAVMPLSGVVILLGGIFSSFLLYRNEKIEKFDTPELQQSQ